MKGLLSSRRGLVRPMLRQEQPFRLFVGKIKKGGQELVLTAPLARVMEPSEFHAQPDTEEVYAGFIGAVVGIGTVGVGIASQRLQQIGLG